MKKSNIIVLALSTLLVVCNALPMNNHVENKKKQLFHKKRHQKRNQRKKMYPKMKPMKVIKLQMIHPNK